MLNASLRRKIVLCFLLVTVLAVPWASAAEPPAQRSSDLLHRAWSFLLSLWSEEGCHIDPSGGCSNRASAPPLPAVQTETGCHIDPSGGCHS